MPDLSFKEWVKQKADKANSERARRRAEWTLAYRKLLEEILTNIMT